MALVLFFVLSISSVFARIILVPKPEEMADQATLICNGVVEAITENSIDKDLVRPWDSVTHLTAKIKIVHVFKGNAPPEIEIAYRSGPHPPNGPYQIHLTEGERYRFFLKNGKSGSSFVSVLDKQYDDGFAVEPLAPKEPDDSPYVSEKEAKALVEQWLKQNHPDFMSSFLKRGETSFRGNSTWAFLLSKANEKPLCITVLGDRTIKEQPLN